MKSLEAQRKIHKLYALYLAVHAYAVNTTFSPFLQGSMGEQLGCKWHCYESQVLLTVTHPASAQSFIKRRCCSKRATKNGREKNLNKKSDRPSTSNKTQSPPILKKRANCNSKRWINGFLQRYSSLEVNKYSIEDSEGTSRHQENKLANQFQEQT